MQVFRTIKRFFSEFQEFRMLKANLELPEDMDLGRYIALQAREIRTLKLRSDPKTNWGPEQTGWDQVEPGLYVRRE